METPVKRRRNSGQRPKLGEVPPNLLFAVLAPAYELSHEDAFLDLQEVLTDIACRELGDPETPPPSATDLTLRRADGYEQARTIQSLAREASAALATIKQAMGALLADAIKRDDHMLEQIFDVQVPRIGDSPLRQQLGSLLSDLHGTSWVEVERNLAELASLPVKAVLDRGSVRQNAALFQSVSACRKYWEGSESKSWSMYKIKDTSIRSKNASDDIKGSCERFVHDVIRYYGIPFDLQALSSTWQAVDSARRRGPFEA